MKTPDEIINEAFDSPYSKLTQDELLALYNDKSKYFLKACYESDPIAKKLSTEIDMLAIEMMSRSFDDPRG